ncbi:hypothetical protein J6590_049537 [Homalodisca vitripennis]|nr:hypothetical protein J6590_049537 [Homalodisca vitripennis]
MDPGLPNGCELGGGSGDWGFPKTGNFKMPTGPRVRGLLNDGSYHRPRHARGQQILEAGRS